MIEIILFVVVLIVLRQGVCFQVKKTSLIRKNSNVFSLLPPTLKEKPQILRNQNGSALSIGMVCARWNSDIVENLYEGVLKSLKSCEVKIINRTWAPGSFELPFAAKMLADTRSYDAIICLGCLVKGETMHFEYISQAVSYGIMKVQLESGIPCLFGVLTVMNKQQAIVRSTGDTNEGLSWGFSAVEMGLLRTMNRLDKN